MKDMKTRAVEQLYWPLYLLRLMFLSSSLGVWIHQRIVARGVQAIWGEESAARAQYAHNSLDGNPGMIAWIKRMYTLAPSVRSRMMKNVILWGGVVGARMRRKLREQGMPIPSFLFISLTYRCNLACTGLFCEQSTQRRPIL